ncbi:unnamed protein product [Paramecium octaurelia]|uniref:Uncharacterized protein n=1 Tax=Paramecium octaurelia TaxID=43137 RepID=A0A8S1S0H2_PAROT|nr:unnamed protein product [Paramecium octaurelia]
MFNQYLYLIQRQQILVSSTWPSLNSSAQTNEMTYLNCIKLNLSDESGNHRTDLHKVKSIYLNFVYINQNQC